MQTLVGLWQTSGGFSLAPCNQMIRQEQTTGCLSLFVVVYLQIETTFPMRPHLMRIIRFQHIVSSNLMWSLCILQLICSHLVCL